MLVKPLRIKHYPPGFTPATVSAVSVQRKPPDWLDAIGADDRTASASICLTRVSQPATE